MQIKNADRIFIIGNIDSGNIDTVKVFPSESFESFNVEVNPIISKGYDRRDVKREVWKTARDRKPRLVVACNAKINDDLILPLEMFEELPEEVPLSKIRGEIV